MQTRSWRCVAAGVGALLLGACASPISLVAGRYQRVDPPFRIDAPGPGWEREALDGAQLAFRRRDGSRFSLLARCRGPVTDAQLMARQLLIGTTARQLVESGPTTLAGREAWGQTVVLRNDGAAARLRSVTQVVGACVYDLLLVSPDGVVPPDAEFDAWCSTFEPNPGGGGG